MKVGMKINLYWEKDLPSPLMDYKMVLDISEIT